MTIAHRGFGSMNPSSSRNRMPIPSDLVDLLKLSAEPLTLRLVGDVVGVAMHSIKARKRDGSEVTLLKPCLGYNAETDEIDGPCPYCDLPHGQDEIQRVSHVYYVNAIVRQEQEQEPAKKSPPTPKEQETGFKDKNSRTWTPVSVLRVPSSLATRMKKLGERNFVKNAEGEKEAYDINHPRYGLDIEVAFDKDSPPANMYSADPVESPEGTKLSPLTKEERAYLLYDLSLLQAVEDEKEAKREAASLRRRWYGEDEDEGVDDEPSRKRSVATKAKKRAVDLDDGDTVDEGFDLDDSPKRSKAAKKKRAVEDEDDEGFDLDEPAPNRSRTKRAAEDDDDFDLDKPKPNPKKRAEDDDDDDDEPNVTKSKKRAVEDDDFDLDDIPF